MILLVCKKCAKERDIEVAACECGETAADRKVVAAAPAPAKKSKKDDNK